MKYIYKNIKTGEYLRYYDYIEKKYYDVSNIENSHYVEDDYYNSLRDGNITNCGNYEILQYNQELRKLKLRTLDNFS